MWHWLTHLTNQQATAVVDDLPIVVKDVGPWSLDDIEAMHSTTCVASRQRTIRILSNSWMRRLSDPADALSRTCCAFGSLDGDVGGLRLMLQTLLWRFCNDAVVAERCAVGLLSLTGCDTPSGGEKLKGGFPAALHHTRAMKSLWLSLPSLPTFQPKEKRPSREKTEVEAVVLTQSVAAASLLCGLVHAALACLASCHASTMLHDADGESSAWWEDVAWLASNLCSVVHVLYHEPAAAATTRPVSNRHTPLLLLSLVDSAVVRHLSSCVTRWCPWLLQTFCTDVDVALQCSHAALPLSLSHSLSSTAWALVLLAGPALRPHDIGAAVSAAARQLNPRTSDHVLVTQQREQQVVDEVQASDTLFSQLSAPALPLGELHMTYAAISKVAMPEVLSGSGSDSSPLLLRLHLQLLSSASTSLLHASPAAQAATFLCLAVQKQWVTAVTSGFAQDIAHGIARRLRSLSSPLVLGSGLVTRSLMALRHVMPLVRPAAKTATQDTDLAAAVVACFAAFETAAWADMQAIRDHRIDVVSLVCRCLAFHECVVEMADVARSCAGVVLPPKQADASSGTLCSSFGATMAHCADMFQRVLEELLDVIVSTVSSDCSSQTLGLTEAAVAIARVAHRNAFVTSAIAVAHVGTMPNDSRPTRLFEPHTASLQLKLVWCCLLRKVSAFCDLYDNALQDVVLSSHGFASLWLYRVAHFVKASHAVQSQPLTNTVGAVVRWYHGEGRDPAVAHRKVMELLADMLLAELTAVKDLLLMTELADDVITTVVASSCWRRLMDSALFCTLAAVRPLLVASTVTAEAAATLDALLASLFESLRDIHARVSQQRDDSRMWTLSDVSVSELRLLSAVWMDGRGWIRNTRYVEPETRLVDGMLAVPRVRDQLRNRTDIAIVACLNATQRRVLMILLKCFRAHARVTTDGIRSRSSAALLPVSIVVCAYLWPEGRLELHLDTAEDLLRSVASLSSRSSD